MYWDISRALERGCLFNFIVGARGGGKTYGTKQLGIDNFLRDGSQWAYVRRYKAELDASWRTYYNDIASAYPDHKFDCKGRVGYIDGRPATWFIPLSTAKIRKSVAYPAVTDIVFDEFILDRGVYHYLQDEVVQFLELYETIARMRDVRVWFLANALTIVNPYFSYFKLRPPERGKIITRGDILIETTGDPEYEAAKAATRFGRIIQGTDYGAYAVESEYLRDDPTNVERKPSGCYYLCTILTADGDLGFWGGPRGLVWASRDVDTSCRDVYNLDRDDVSDIWRVRSDRRPPVLDTVRRAYDRGMMRFDRQEIKARMGGIIRYLRRA